MFPRAHGRAAWTGWGPGCARLHMCAGRRGAGVGWGLSVAGPGRERAHQLDVVDGLLPELLQRPLGVRLQGEGQALQGLVLALHADLCLHLGAALSERVLTPRTGLRPAGSTGLASPGAPPPPSTPTSLMRICCSSLSAEVSGAGAAQDDRCFWYPARERSSCRGCRGGSGRLGRAARSP